MVRWASSVEVLISMEFVCEIMEKWTMSSLYRELVF